MVLVTWFEGGQTMPCTMIINTHYTTVYTYYCIYCILYCILYRMGHNFRGSKISVISENNLKS